MAKIPVKGAALIKVGSVSFLCVNGATLDFATSETSSQCEDSGAWDTAEAGTTKATLKADGIWRVFSSPDITPNVSVQQLIRKQVAGETVPVEFSSGIIGGDKYAFDAIITSSNMSGTTSEVAKFSINMRNAGAVIITVITA